MTDRKPFEDEMWDYLSKNQMVVIKLDEWRRAGVANRLFDRVVMALHNAATDINAACADVEQATKGEQP